MRGRTCIAAARATVLGMVVGTAAAGALGMLGSRFDAGTTVFTIVYYLAPPIGAALGARAAARGLGQGPREARRAAGIVAAAIALSEAAFIWLGWWLEASEPGPADPLLTPTCLLAPIVPAALLSMVGVVLAGRADEDAEPRPREALLVGLMLLGAGIGLPLGFLGAMSIGMIYAESMGTCSIGAMGHAMLSVIVGPVAGAWMARWAAIKWGASLLKPVT
jgi:hypothetical protein